MSEAGAGIRTRPINCEHTVKHYYEVGCARCWATRHAAGYTSSPEMKVQTCPKFSTMPESYAWCVADESLDHTIWWASLSLPICLPTTSFSLRLGKCPQVLVQSESSCTQFDLTPSQVRTITSSFQHETYTCQHFCHCHCLLFFFIWCFSFPVVVTNFVLYRDD